MKILNLVQGTPEWHEARANAFTASEAPMMMGASPFKTREQYLKEKALGIKEEISPFLQKKFDEGHAAEERARVLLEESLGEEFYPVVGEVNHEGMRLLASFDGLTMAEDCAWEHKLWNEKKAEQMRNANELLPEYYWQVEHGLLVSGANECIFEMSDGSGDPDKRLEITYASVPQRRKMLIEGWKQFQQDLASYEKKVEFKPVTKQEIAIPEINIEVIGQVKASNLPAVKSQVTAMIEAINEDLQSDDDFAAAEKAVKELDKAEKKLEAAKVAMLDGTMEISEIVRTIDELKDASRVKRLALNKLVKERKEAMKQEIVQGCARELSAHIETLNRELKIVKMPYSAYGLQDQFTQAIKGKKLFSSMREAAADALSQAKVHATICAQELNEKIELFNELATGYESLFSDKSFLYYDTEEQIENRVKAAIAHYEEQQERTMREQQEKLAARKAQPTPEPEVSQPEPSKPVTYQPTAAEQALMNLGCSQVQALRILTAIESGQIPGVTITKQSEAA